MNEKNDNIFKFSLTQGDVVLTERIFDGNVFNPYTRYSIDIRKFLPKIITKFQKVLSKRYYNVSLNGYNLKDLEYKTFSNMSKDVKHQMMYNPRVSDFMVENKRIVGVECKLSLYINDNLIVERVFYVDGFNPISKNSVDLLDVFNESYDMIYRSIRKRDIKNMWDDYDMINKLGMSINKIRELPQNVRYRIIRNMNNEYRW
jgi:hypothetical protein